MSYEAMPQVPEVWFWSGDRAVCLRAVGITREGTDYKRMYLVLTEQIKWRYGIDEDKLDYEISGDGVYISEYPAAHFHKVTDNPENPVIIMTCNFDGTESSGTDFIALKNENAKCRSTIRALQAENSRSRSELKKALERTRALNRSSIR